MKYLAAFHESLCRGLDYYKSIDGKLALRFLNEVEAALEKIRQFPKIGKAMPKYRVLILKEFPYSICYYEKPQGTLYGLVLYHHKQKQPRSP